MTEREPGELWIFGNAVDPEKPPAAEPPDEPGQAPGTTRVPSSDAARPAEASGVVSSWGGDEPALPAPEPTEAPDLPIRSTQLPFDTSADSAGLPAAGPSSAPRRAAMLIVAGAVVLVLVVVGATLAVVQHSSRGVSADPSIGAVVASASATPSDDAGEPQPSASETTSEPSDDPSDDPSDSAPTTRPDDAKKLLEELSDEGVAQVSLDGQDVAMVASKWNGVRDPLQKTADGSHTFHYADILAEHERLASEDNHGASLVMLRGTDYGKRRKSPDGKTIYVTFALGPWDTRDEVEKWCKKRFAGLSKAERDDTCVPTKLTD